MRVEVLKGFASERECAELNKFTLDCVTTGKFIDGVASRPLNQPGQHMVSRFNNTLEYPDVAYVVRARIMSTFSLAENQIFTAFNPSGIAVNCTFNGGQLRQHVDSATPNFALLRATVVTSQPEQGGQFYFDGNLVPMRDGDLYCCLVSEALHYATPNESDKPRIVWQFGFDVAHDEWEHGMRVL
jgi:hypothetical protein